MVAMNKLDSQFDLIYKYAEQILDSKGTMGNWNPVTLGDSFEDERLIIEARISQQGHYDILLIAVKIPSDTTVKTFIDKDYGFIQKPDEAALNTHVATLRKDSPEVTHVRGNFFRPGRWIKYLYHLYDETLENIKAAQALNEKPVNDETLFPEEKFI